MDRRITGFRLDDEDHWVAILNCHHGHHVRHRPPWELREWTLSETGRQDRIGEMLDCPKCEWVELPTGLVIARTTPEWTHFSLPAGLERDHRVVAGVWGRVRVLEGGVRFEFTDGLGGAPERPLVAGQDQPIPPDRPHRLELVGAVRLVVDFLVPSDTA